MRILTARTPATTNIGFEPRGYLHIAGGFAKAHHSDIETVLRTEEQRAHRISPEARILARDDKGDGLLVSTTTEHLAHRLGHALHKNLGGELHHGFLRDNKLALVWWRR